MLSHKASKVSGCQPGQYADAHSFRSSSPYDLSTRATTNMLNVVSEAASDAAPQATSKSADTKTSRHGAPKNHWYSSGIPGSEPKAE